MSTMPFKSPEPEPHSRGGSASIGKAVKINGQIFSKEDLYIDGDIEGTIEALENKITIGAHGKVQSHVRAREVVILGHIQGNVEASERIDIRKDARLVGDIKTARIIIEDGAFFKGSIDIVKQEPVKVAAPPQPPPRVQTPPPPVPTPASGPVTVASGAAEGKR